MPTMLGIDIGGTGIKGAPVDTATGELLVPRVRIETPQPATPPAVAKVVTDLAKHFDWTGPIGAAFPTVVKNGTVLTANNVDHSWIGCDAALVFSNACGGVPVTVLNDADAAGVGEMRFGAGKGRRDTVVMVTLGTGIGTAVFFDGELFPNAQLGGISIRGKPGELRAAASVRERKNLSWKQWAKRLNEYFAALEDLIWPDLIIIGGGVSEKADKFLPLLRTRADLVPATLRNDAGIVGAALVVPSASPAGH